MSDNACNCYALDERVAIMIESGIPEDTASKLAEQDTCRGCEKYRKQMELI